MDEGVPRVSGEYLIPPSQIYAAIERAEHHHAEMVNAQLATLIARLDAMDRERYRLFVIVQDEIPEAIAHALNEGVTLVRAEIETLAQRHTGDNDAIRDRMALLAAELETKITAHAHLDIKSFESVDLRFTERDKRFELQNVEHQKAIDKAERATADTIDKNAEVIDKQLNAIRDTVNDVKDRLVVLESMKRGAVEERGEHRAQGFDQRAVIALGISVILALIGVIGFVVALVERAQTP